MVDATFHWVPSLQKGGGVQYLTSWYSTFPGGGFLSNGPIDENQAGSPSAA
jgi:hypothetical protein